MDLTLPLSCLGFSQYEGYQQLALFQGPMRVLAEITTDSTYWFWNDYDAPNVSQRRCLGMSHCHVCLENTTLYYYCEWHFKKPVNIHIGSGSTTNSMWCSPHWTAINCSWSLCPPFFASRSPQALQVSSDLNNNTSSPRPHGKYHPCMRASW